MAVEAKPVQELAKQAQSFEQEARAFIVQDKVGYEAAAELLKVVNGLIDEVHASQDPICDATNKAHKTATTERKRLLDPLVGAQTILKSKQAIWYLADERRRQLAMNEEREKREAEAKAAQAAEAKRLYDAGQRNAAKAVKAAPIIIAPIIVEEAPKVESQSVRKCWKFVVEEPDKVPFRYREISEALIRAQVQATGNTLPIPGVRIFEDVQFVRKS